MVCRISPSASSTAATGDSKCAAACLDNSYAILVVLFPALRLKSYIVHIFLNRRVGHGQNFCSRSCSERKRFVTNLYFSVNRGMHNKIKRNGCHSQFQSPTCGPPPGLPSHWHNHSKSEFLKPTAPSWQFGFRPCKSHSVYRFRMRNRMLWLEL